MHERRRRGGAFCALLLGAACGSGDSAARTAALQAHGSPATWEDLDAAHPGTRLRDPRTGIVFLRVPAGEYTKGSGAAPGPRIVVSRAFLLAETELTVAQWRRHVEAFGGDASVPAPADDTLPMPVSWLDAQRFVARYGYRLPTEAEWERACRTDQPAGEAPWRSAETLAAHAWSHGNAGNGSRPVRTRSSNAFGFFDMLGNLWEWCEDGFGPAATGPGPLQDPKRPDQGQGRVLRGGSWFTMGRLHPELRTGGQVDERNTFYGVRPARDL